MSKAWASPLARHSTRRAISSSAIAAVPSSKSIASAKRSVHATLEPSVAAYHLAVNAAGTLLVTAPSLSSNEAIWAVEPNGDTRAWFRGLGRPQGLAISSDGDVFVAACLHGRQGLVRITPSGQASLVLTPPTSSSASPSLHSEPPSSPPTTPFMMWTWESKA